MGKKNILDELRIKAGFTKTDVAKASGVAVKTYNRAAGLSLPTTKPETKSKILNAFNGLCDKNHRYEYVYGESYIVE